MNPGPYITMREKQQSRPDTDCHKAYGSIGGRSATQGYGTDDKVRQQYTGYQHEDESGLEYAQARNYNSAHGRFTSVDPLMASANVKNPQTLNRYSYVLNSPYKFVDPLGLLSVTTGACGQWCQGSDGGSGGAFGIGYTTGMDNASQVNITNRIYQREVRVYTVVQTEADGRQATITITSEVDRIIDSQTKRTLETSNPRVSATAQNTGTTPFSSSDLDTMRDVARDIVDVSLTNGYSPQAAIAQAQRETHLGVGAFGDRESNRSRPEMGMAVNPLQVDGNANGGNFASATDRKGNILKGMQQLNNSYPNSKDFAERLGHYNDGGVIGPKGKAYAKDVLQKMGNIRESHRYVNGWYNAFSGRVVYPIVY